MNHFRLAALSSLLLTLCLCGCAQHYTYVPSKSSFAYSPESEQLSPNTAPRFGRYMQTAVWDMPHAQDLIDAWGDPDDWRVSWWALMPFTWIPPIHPMTTWFWQVGDRRIYATVNHPIIYGYEAHVWILGVEDHPQEKAPQP